MPAGRGPYYQQHDWSYCLGLDLGERDDNAFVVGAFADTCRELYIVDTYNRSHMSIDELYAKYKELEFKYCGADSFVFAVADTGGYGRGVVTELQNRLNLPLIAANKRKEKLGDIALMNNDFLSGRIKLRAGSRLATEFSQLVKKIRLSDHKVILQHSDLGDAALYMYKASLHWSGKDMEVKPLYNSPKYWQDREQADVEKAVQKRASKFEQWPTDRSDGF